MFDTAQPAAPSAADSRGAPDALALAAQAFKASVGQGRSEIPGHARDDEEEGLDPGLRRGDEESRRDDDEAEDAGSGIPDQVRDDAGTDDEAADEAQPDEAPLPKSWPEEQAELWESLPPEARAFIALREGQRDAAVNGKFQEAANLRKAHEAEIGEAKANRQRYAEAVDQVLSLVVPQMPPRTMLDRRSADYDPDAYHYRKALHEDTVAFLSRHRTQRQQIAAQEDAARFNALNDATRDAFIASVPDIADQARAPALFQELIDYAVALGTPADTFESPTTAFEWHVLWKAREYDRLQSARARVQDTRPEPKKAQPAVRPGVATRREAVEQQQRGAAMDRLRREGSLDAGAAALKHLLKGN